MLLLLVMMINEFRHTSWIQLRVLGMEPVSGSGPVSSLFSLGPFYFFGLAGFS